MRTCSVLLSACLIGILLIASSLARPLSIQQPVVRGVTVIGSQGRDLRPDYRSPNRWHFRPGWTWRSYGRRINPAWDGQMSSWVPAAAGSYGPVYGVGPDAPYSGSAIYYPLETKKQKPRSENSGQHLPKVVYGISPEVSAPYPSMLFGTMPDKH
jgi:hypothetical protein